MFLKHIRDIDLRDIMEYYPEKGNIFINDSRSVIYDTNSLGLLIRDLSDVLGFEKAKRFMFRYGWNRGFRNAEILEKKYGYKDDIEWLLAGAKMHQMQGFLKVEVLEAQIDKTNGTFFMMGIWYDSYEAEEYLKHYGKSNKPVCTIETGYASGYATAVFQNKTIIFKEVKCVAMGDEYCQCIGKTLDEWEGEVTQEISYLEEGNLNDPQGEIYRKFERYKEANDNALKIENKLTQEIVRGGGLNEICLTLSNLLNAPILIENTDFSLYISTGVSDKLSAQYSTSFMNLNSESKDSALAYAMAQLTENKEPVKLSIPEKYGIGHRRIIAPILVKNETYGYISMIYNDETQYDYNLLCIKRAAWVCSLFLLQEKKVVELEERMLGQFLDDILTSPVDKKKIMIQSKYLGYNLSTKGYMFLIEDTTKNADNFEQKNIRLLQNHFDGLGEKYLIAEKEGFIILLLNEQYLLKKKTTIRCVGETIIELLHRSSPHVIWNIGISRKYEDISEIPKIFEEAKKLLKINKQQVGKSRILTYDELGIFRVFLQQDNANELQLLTIGKLERLMDYDKERNSELIKTLYYYIINECNMYKSARALNLSLGGIRYRLKKIQELYDGDLKSAEERFQIYFALKYLVMLNELEL